MTQRPPNTGNSGKTVPPGLKPFKKGQSGNPNGRPKVAEEFREGCRRILDAKVLKRWEREIDEDGPDWVKASELIAGYAVGKPSQAVEHKGKAPVALIVDLGSDE